VDPTPDTGRRGGTAPIPHNWPVDTDDRCPWCTVCVHYLQRYCIHTTTVYSRFRPLTYI
jgi:hypothetical protein